MPVSAEIDLLILKLLQNEKTNKPGLYFISISGSVLSNKLAFYSFFTDAGLNAFHIPFNIAPFTINKNYRIYYTFSAPGNEMYFKGHGDVAIR